MMVDPLRIGPDERGTVRLYAVDIEPQDRKDMLRPRPDTPPLGARLGALLGVDWIDPDHADLFDVADLESLGLPGLLIDGAGIAEADVAPLRPKLLGIEGTVLVVYAKGFGDAPLDLRPSPMVVPIAAFAEHKTPISFAPLTSDAAEGQLETDVEEPPQNAYLTVILALLALPIFVLLVGAIVWGFS